MKNHLADSLPRAHPGRLRGNGHQTGSRGQARSGHQPELDKTITDAEQAIAAAKKGGLWRDTEKFLDDAKGQGRGQDRRRHEAGKKALKEAQLALKQATAEAANGKPYFPSNDIYLNKKPGIPGFLLSAFYPAPTGAMFMA